MYKHAIYLIPLVHIAYKRKQFVFFIITSSFLFHMTIIYHHMSDKHKQEPMSVKESAEKPSKLKLPKPSDTIDHRNHNKAWR